MDSNFESFLNGLIRVNKYSDLQQRVARIHACIEVITARVSGEPDPVVLDDIESIPQQINSISKALAGEDIKVKNIKKNHSYLWVLMEGILSPYLRKHHLSDLQIEITINFLNHMSIKGVSEKMFTSERNIGYHRNEITRKLGKNTFQEVIDMLWEMFSTSFTIDQF